MSGCCCLACSRRAGSPQGRLGQSGLLWCHSVLSLLEKELVRSAEAWRSESVAVMGFL